MEQSNVIDEEPADFAGGAIYIVLIKSTDSFASPSEVIKI